MELNDYYQISQIIYAAVGTIFFILAIAFLITLLRKINSIEIKISELSERASCIVKEIGSLTNTLSFKFIKRLFSKKEEK